MDEATRTQAIHTKPAFLVDGSRHELPIGLYRVGRDPQSHLVLSDTSLSRLHFVVDVSPHQAQLIDVGSSNGTFVNRKKVRSIWLKNGDRIRIGDHSLLFSAPLFPASRLENSGIAEATTGPDLKSSGNIGIVSMLALMVAGASLFLQLLNREQFMQRQEAPFRWKHRKAKPATQSFAKTLDEQWLEALKDFKDGDEEKACASVRDLLKTLTKESLLKLKAQSFYERKCRL
ncbi:MAG: FHA domain-containing protein [Myxococcaceae bacterium]|nr:FHA domain-containing protein [Myxococcaceae bacterium]MBH2006743.1 FHA domain-containing protein [Myxococcaceae bacterium]